MGESVLGGNQVGDMVGLGTGRDWAFVGSMVGDAVVGMGTDGDSLLKGDTEGVLPEASFVASRRAERETGMAMAATIANTNKTSTTLRHGRRYHFLVSSAWGMFALMPSSRFSPSSAAMVGVSYYDGRLKFAVL